MIKRTIEISEGPAHLAVKNSQLVIKRDSQAAYSVPLEDLGFLIVDHPGVTYTHRVLCELAAFNVALVLCGSNHHPVGLILPGEGHTFHGETVSFQAVITDTVKGRLWKEIIKAKIINQAEVLERTRGGSQSILRFAMAVKSGDSNNLEARAARRYWPLLFGKEFRRLREGPSPNNLLNYGYAILRAATARSLCGAGLHPALGLHHRNRYNAFALADDLMEPFRPMVDAIVYGLWQRGERTLTKPGKEKLLEIPALPVRYREQDSSLMIAFQRTAAELREVISGNAKRLELPSFIDIRVAQR